MRKFPSRTLPIQAARALAAALTCLVIALLVPVVLYKASSLETEVLWNLAVAWWVGVFVAAVAWTTARARRNQELRSSVSLHVDLLPPEKSRYQGSFQFTYENRGSLDLQAIIELFVYPSTRGRNEMWNPAFRKDFRDEIMSLGPFESHDLILGARETQDYPYSRSSVLQACGLHEYVPHWLTLKLHVWPRGMRRLARTQIMHFYLLWFCGKEERFPGSWLVEPIRIRTRDHNNRKSRTRWRGKLTDEVPTDYLQGNLQDYIDLVCTFGEKAE